MKKDARDYAELNLNSFENLKELNQIVKNVEFNPLTPELSLKIKNFQFGYHILF